MPTVDELINFAINQQPTKFASAFDDIMGEKTTAAIDAMRTDVAQGIYAAEEDDLDVEDHDDEELDADIDDDIDDDEFDDVDDLDLDDEDLDFDDDTDLEGLDDDGENA
jgi:hypothetical protein